MTQRPIVTNLEYEGWMEGILVLNYEVLKIVVLLCNWVKGNYNGSSATIKRDEYAFTLMNCFSLIPISDASFVFPLHINKFFLHHTQRNEVGRLFFGRILVGDTY
jgi:hypothetical protein